MALTERNTDPSEVGRRRKLPPIDRVAHRTCPLCEATCGLELAMSGDQLVRVRGDRDDVFSAGYICPKGSALGALVDDPDRLRVPMLRRDGVLVEVSWAEAFAEVERLLAPIVADGDRNSIAAYVGNPNAHNLSGLVYGRVLLQAMGSRNVFSASTVDQMPKHVSAGLMFGTPLTVPVPDVDRTHLLVVLGANPLASNGSLLTAPDLPGRLDGLRGRGGRLVVIDPRRSETAEIADQWIPLRPATDALLLAAVVNVLFSEDLVDLGSVADHLAGIDDLARLVEPFTPAGVAPLCGIEPVVVQRLARDLAAAPSAAVYGRIGTCTQEFGTLTSWLVDVVNIITGNLDRPGGAMFTKAAAGAANTRGTAGRGRGFRIGRHHSRVRELPEALGELPVAALAEEIETPGEGQIRALVTVAGNPVLSTPNAARLDAALASLEVLICVDVYLNETTRRADVVLPAPDPLRKDHYDLALYQLACRNVANYSPPVVALDDGQPDEWEILAHLALILQGQGADADPAAVDDMIITDLASRAVRDEHGPVHGRDPDDLVAELSRAGRRGPSRILDLQLRTGPYGDGFGAAPTGLSLDRLLENPHGIDLGPLEPRIPEVLRTPSGKIELVPEPIAADVDRLVSALQREPGDGHMVLVGRRHVRSNNSWMHNIGVLVKGARRDRLQIHPDDAATVGIEPGGSARVRSRVGEVTVDVEVTDVVRPGVVSLPHGWGHDVDGVRLSVASERAVGVNTNLLTDESVIDPLSGNAVLNGIPVEVFPA